MAIRGFFGLLGSGKDLTLNYTLNQPQFKDIKIISHSYLKKKHISIDIESIFEKARTNTLFFKDSILYLNEFDLVMESRRSNAAVNVDFSQMLLKQLSKIDCHLWYTCQDPSQIDKRIIQLQKYFYFCEKKFRYTENLFNLVDDPYNPNEKIQLINLIDWDKRIVINPITKQPIPFDVQVNYLERSIKKTSGFIEKRFKLPWEYLQSLFDQYDTREIIKFDREKFKKS